MAAGLFDLFSAADQTAAAGAQTTGLNAGYGQLADLYSTGRGTAAPRPFIQNYSNANAASRSWETF